MKQIKRRLWWLYDHRVDIFVVAAVVGAMLFWGIYLDMRATRATAQCLRLFEYTREQCEWWVKR